MGSLSNLYISQSYISLIHLGTNSTITTASVELQDGLGNGIGVFVNSLGDVNINGTFEADLQKGYVWVGDASGRTSLVATSSFIDSQITSASFNAYTQSTNIRLNNIESTTASLNISISNLNSTTASQAISITNLNSFTQSAQTQLNGLSSKTGSYATTGSNSFNGNQTITGSLDVLSNNANININTTGTGNLNINAVTPDGSSSFINIQSDNGHYPLIYARVKPSAYPGDIFGGFGVDDLDDGNNNMGMALQTYTNAFPGQLVTSVYGGGVGNAGDTNTFIFNSNKLYGYKDFYLTGSLNIATGYTFTAPLNTGYAWVGDNLGKAVQVATSSFATLINTGSFVTTSSFNSYTSSTDGRLNNIETTTASLNTSITNINSFTQSARVSLNNLNSTTASLNTSVTNINSATASLFTSASLSLTTASFDTGSRNLTFTKGNASVFAVNIPATPSVDTGSLMVTGSVNVNILTFTKGDGTTFNLAVAASGSVTPGTISGSAQISALGFVSSSVTASSLVTASFNNGTRNLTFTKGDASTFSVNIPDVSGSTGNFATTGSNQFNGNQSISGSVTLSGSLNNVDYVDFNTASATPAWKSGRVFWDNTDGCLAVYNVEQDVTLQVGQENWTRVYNGTGLTIANGTAVRLSGTHGDVPEVVLAQAIAISGSANVTNQILGLATHTIETGTYGYITTQGLVRGLNTNAFTDGATLYVSQSAGLLTTTPPAAPYESIPIGQCVKASPGASGIIYVAVEQPIDFSDLSSVLVSGSYSDGDMWQYVGSGATGSWRHNTIAQIGLTTTSSFNSYTSSTNSRLNSLEAKTGSYATTGSNTFNGTEIISGALLISASGVDAINIENGNIAALNSTIGAYVFNGSFVNLYNQNAGIGLALNAAGSGSQYPQVNMSVDSNTWPHDIYGGLQVQDPSLSYYTYIGVVANSYAPEYNGEVVGWIGGGANNANGSNTAIIMRTGSANLEIYKPIVANFDLRVIGSLTASLATGYTWVGNGSNVSTLVATSSFLSTIATGSFATTGSNSFNGNQSITGSLTISSSAAVDLTVIGGLTVTGSAYGNVVSMSITANTASMNLALGNYFTLTLADTATTHISASNVQPGVSATLVITTGTNSSASLAPTMLQPSGNTYSATNGSAKKDVLSIVAVASGVPYVVSTKNMV